MEFVRLFESVQFRLLLRPVLFNQRRRTAVFLIMKICLWTSIFLLYRTTPYSVLTIPFMVRMWRFWATFTSFLPALVLAILNEYCMKNMDRTPASDDWCICLCLALLSHLGILIGQLQTWMTLFFCRDDIFNLSTCAFMIGLFLLNNSYGLSTLLELMPIVYHIRRRQSNQQIRVLAWYVMDICESMPAQVPLNPMGAGAVPLHLLDLAWPWMDEMPSWIAIKLSQHAAPAG